MPWPEKNDEISASVECWGVEVTIFKSDHDGQVVVQVATGPGGEAVKDE